LVTQQADFFLELQTLVESVMNRLSLNLMGLVILHFGGDIGDGSLCVQGPLIHRRRQRFRLLRPLKIVYMCILIKALLW
jgi:hypothetical protein